MLPVKKLICHPPKDAFPGQNFESPVRLPLGLAAGKAVKLCKSRCAAGAASAFVLGPGEHGRSGMVYFRAAPKEDK